MIKCEWAFGRTRWRCDHRPVKNNAPCRSPAGCAGDDKVGSGECNPRSGFIRRLTRSQPTRVHFLWQRNFSGGRETRLHRIFGRHIISPSSMVKVCQFNNISVFSGAMPCLNPGIPKKSQRKSRPKPPRKKEKPNKTRKKRDKEKTHIRESFGGFAPGTGLLHPFLSLVRNRRRHSAGVYVAPGLRLFCGDPDIQGGRPWPRWYPFGRGPGECPPPSPTPPC